MRFKSFLILAFTLAALLSAVPACAEGKLPDIVQAQFDAPLKEVGSGIYRKFGFSIYRATLWAPHSKWDNNEPYALELHYRRSLSKSTLVDAIMDDIRDQNVADDDMLSRWEADLNKSIPDVEDGDVMIGVASGDGEATLYFNGSEISHSDDAAFTHAFFNVWLGDGADKDLQIELLGKDPD